MAIAKYKKAIELTSSKSQRDEYESKLAYALMGLKRDKEAVAIYKKLMRTAENKYKRRECMQNLLQIYERHGKLDKVTFGEL